MVNKLFMTKLFSALFMLFLTVAVFPVSADDRSEQQMPAPQAVAKEATDRMLKALKDNKLELENNPDLIYELVKDVLTPNFDFAKIAKLALGKNWRTVSEIQKMRFTEEFRLLLIRTYSATMLEFTDEEVRFLLFRDDINTKKVTVKMEILQTGGPSIPMALSMYLNGEDKWKVYDVKIDGISLVTNYRSTFATRIRNDGMDKLLDELASRNEKVKL